MLKGRDIIGKPVVAYDTGENLKKVNDIIFARDNRLLGFLINNGRAQQVLTLEGVQAIGRDALIAKSKYSMADVSLRPEIGYILQRDYTLRGTRILTTDGRDLGRIVEVYFNEETGAVEGYEISGGTFPLGYSGPLFIPASQIIKFGSQVGFVPAEIADSLAMLVEAANAAKQNLKEVNGTANYTVEYARGSIAQRALRNESGSIIIAPGQVVTQAAIEQARFHRREQQLLGAVGLITLNDPWDAEDYSSASFDRGFAKTQAHAHNFWEWCRNKWHDFTEHRAQERETKRIKAALGRPSQRVILDERDNVILNVGDLVTNQAIERARYANVLDVLLDSVDEQKAEVSDEERKAPVAGEASLEKQEGIEERNTVTHHS
jgi:uncharacterized protein YrrD